MPKQRKSKLKKSDSIILPIAGLGAPRIATLPVEIFYLITSEFSRDDLKSLRSVHRQLKVWVNLILFETVGIRLRNFPGKPARADATAAIVDRMYEATLQLNGSEILGMAKTFSSVVDHNIEFYKHLKVGMTCLTVAFQRTFPRLLKLFSAVEVVDAQVAIEDFEVKDGIALFKTLGENLSTRRLKAKVTGITPNRAIALSHLRNLDTLCLGYSGSSSSLTRGVQQAIKSSKLSKLEIIGHGAELDKLLDGLDEECLSEVDTLSISEGTADRAISPQNLQKLPPGIALAYSASPPGGRWSLLKDVQPRSTDSTPLIRSLKMYGIDRGLFQYLSKSCSRGLRDLEIQGDPTYSYNIDAKGSRDDAETFVTGAMQNLQGSLRTLSLILPPYHDYYGNTSRMMEYYQRAKHYNFHDGGSPKRFGDLRSLRIPLAYYGTSTMEESQKPFNKVMSAISHSPNLHKISLYIETLDFDNEAAAVKSFNDGTNAEDVFREIEDYKSNGTDLRAGTCLEVEIHQIVKKTKETRFYLWDGIGWKANGFIGECARFP